MNAELLYNPLTPEYRLDPYPALHRLREADPIHWAWGAWCWVLTRYEDIRFVLSSRKFGVGMDRMLQNPVLQPVLAEPYNVIIRTQILAGDPPDHPRIRGLMTRAFNASAVDAMRPQIQRTADMLLDQVLPTGRLDLIADFAHALPFAVICDLLDVPEDERKPLETYTHDLMRTTDPTPMSWEDTAAANAAALGFQAYFLDLAARRRATGGEDFFTYMVQSVDAGLLTEEEFVANMILVFCAGHDTVINLFGNGMLALFRNPDQLQLLREDPGLIKGAIEELLRFDTTLQIGRRTAFEDVEIDGRLIHENAYVLCMLGAGNRDPTIFEDPDRLDVTRKNVRPLSFGGGIHHCLGALLARVEGEIGIARLLQRLPGLTPDTLEPEWKQNVFIRGLKNLHVSFEPADAGARM